MLILNITIADPIMSFSPCLSFMLLCFISFVYADDAACNFSTVVAPITGVQLRSNIYMRGIEMSLGTPPKSYALMPQWPVNNTWFYPFSGLCPSTLSDGTCITRRGGKFDVTQSKTFKNITDPVEVRTISPNDSRPGLWGQETLQVSNITIPDFTFGVFAEDPGNNYDTQHVLGLGPNSTVLSALRTAGHIGSRTLSYFWGLAGATSQATMDGHIVFGGYDKAKVKGSNMTGKIGSSDKCSSGMIVTISDIVLNFPNGSSPSIFSSSGLMPACLQPDFPTVLTLPYYPYIMNFEAITQTSAIARSLGYNFFDLLYLSDSVYQGDLTIKFDSGVAVRVPNSQLVVPDVSIHSDGTIGITNSSVSEVMLMANSDANAADLPQLGRQFFTSAYMMINQEEQTFTLWAANPTTDEDLVPIMDKQAKSTCSVKASNSDNTTTTGSPSFPTPTTISSSNGRPIATDGKEAKQGVRISIGAIVGIAVGGAVGIGLSIFVIVCCLRRRAHARPESEYFHADTTVSGGPLVNLLSKPKYPPQELSTEPRLHELWTGRLSRQPRRKTNMEVHEIG